MVRGSFVAHKSNIAVISETIEILVKQVGKASDLLLRMKDESVRRL